MKNETYLPNQVIRDGFVPHGDWERLFDRNRRLVRTNCTILVVVIATIIALVLMCGARFANDGKLEIQQLIVRDRQGTVRAKIGVDMGGATSLELSDQKGRERLGLTVGSDGVIGIGIVDSAGDSRISLGVLSDGKVSLSMFEKGKGKGALSLGIEEDGSVGVTALGPDGRNLRMMTKSKREAAFTVFSTDLQDYASLGFKPGGGTSLSLMRHNKNIIRMSTFSNNEGIIGVSDSNGTPRLEIGSLARDAMGLYIRNHKGVARVVLDLGTVKK